PVGTVERRPVSPRARTPPAVSRARAFAPIRCRSRSWAITPSRSCPRRCRLMCSSAGSGAPVEARCRASRWEGMFSALALPLQKHRRHQRALVRRAVAGKKGAKSSMGGRVARAAPRDRAQGGAGAVDKSPQTGIGLSTEEDRERARGGLDLSTRIHIFHGTISPPGLDRLVLRG